VALSFDVKGRRPRHLESFAAVAFAAATYIAPAPARAEPPPPAAAPAAADLEREAREAYGRGEFAVAARAFEALHRAAPHASLALNAALAWEKAGDPTRAADAYAAALAAGGLDAEREKRARTHLAQLEQRLGVVAVDGPAGAPARVDGEAAGALPVRVHVSPGEHLIEVASERQKVTVKAGETRALRVSPIKASEASPPPPPPPPPTSRMRVAGWAMQGASVALMAAAIGCGFHTVAVNNAFMAGGDMDQHQHDEAVTFRALTNAAWALAATTAVAGVVLVAAAPRAKAASPAALQVRLTPSGAAVGLSF
jgi:hypothetical protein